MSGDGPDHLVNMATVDPEPVYWLWPAHIPAGKLAILDGDPGLGKSSITIDLSARVTRGDRMPDGSRPYFSGPQQALILTAEDGLADTVRPRLDAADAVPELVSVLRSVPTEDGRGRPPTIDDLDYIEAALVETNARLMVIDPLVAFLPDGVNSYRDKEIRRVLAPLAELAERTGVAIVAIRHLTKANGGKAIYRGGGSIGIIGAARAALVVAPDPDDESESQRILAVTKMNLAPEPPALAYHLEGADGAVRVVWDGESDHSADALMEHPSSDERTAQQEAADVLRSELRGGPVLVSKLKALADRLGISWRTFRRAKSSLGIEHTRDGYDGPWQWRLPKSAKRVGRERKSATLAENENDPEGQGVSGGSDPEVGHTKNVAENGGLKDLQADLGDLLEGDEEVAP